MAVRKSREDATVWIGYADFLTTLTVLFLVFAVSYAAKSRNGTVTIRGVVRNIAALPLQDCAVGIADTTFGATDSRGRFEGQLLNLKGMAKVGVSAACSGYDTVSRFVRVSPGSILTLDLTALRARQIMQIETLTGDALFATESAELTPEGSAMVIGVGERMKSRLQPGYVIAVQGHSDDQQFKIGSAKDNWVLSAERAAAAARVLTMLVGISPCNIVIMGYGPSRPVSPLQQDDSPEEKKAKRKQNRRIEFRQIQGADLQGKCSE